MYWLARHKPYGIVLLTAVLLAASFPPFSFSPLIFIAFVPLFVLFESEVVPIKVPEDKVFRPFKSFFVILFRIATLQFIWRPQTRGSKVLSYRRRMISGNAQLYRYSYTIFLFWNAACCYWLILTAIGSSNLLEALVNGSAGILAIVLNPFLMAMPWQLLSRVRWALPPVFAAATLIPFWLAFEFLHGRWDLSWNWLQLGHALSEWPSLIQYAEWTGTGGISLHILVANLLIYWFYRRLTWFKKISLLPTGLALSWLALPLALHIPLTNPERPLLQPTGQLTVRVVQPNVDPFLKYNYFTPESQIQHMAELINSLPVDSVDLVVLPETAIPRAMDLYGLENNRILQPLWDIVDSFQLSILVGVEEFEHHDEQDSVSASARPAVRGGWIEQYNTAVMLRPDRLLEPHRKSRLVPMVERLPFLEWLYTLRDYNLDLETGMGSYGLPDSLVVPQTGSEIPVGTMICYESVFGQDVRHATRKGASLLAIVTNDGWWQNSGGYLQHGAIARLRAIENRRDIARSANTGQSSFIDHMGKMYQATAWGEEAVIDRKLNLYQGETFYVRNGDFIGWGALWISIVLYFGVLVYRFVPRRKP